MDYLVALLPSIGTGLLFYIVIRAIVNADRNEREALRRLEAAEDAKATPGTWSDNAVGADNIATQANNAGAIKNATTPQ